MLSKTSAGKSLTERLAAMLHGEEGLRLTAYQDSEGNWTIGYGHLILPGDGIYPYDESRTITQARAEELRDHDMGIALGTVARYVHVPLTSNQQLALASFAYNIGETAFKNSTLVKLLNAGDFAAAAAEFPKWNKITRNGAKVTDPILVSRRAREQSLFMTA